MMAFSCFSTHLSLSCYLLHLKHFASKALDLPTCLGVGIYASLVWQGQIFLTIPLS